jgi:two-component system chemotaxis response regulator CheY
MIIITDNTTEILLKYLETARDDHSNERCIYIRMKQVPNLRQHWLEDISIQISLIIDDVTSKFYVCEDGDSFLISPRLTHKKMAEIYNILFPLIETAPDYNSIFSLHEFITDINMLLVAVDDKFKIIQDARLKILKQKQDEERALNEQKQRSILTHKITADIKTSVIHKKNKRDTFEILLIDDDLFSTKMVDTLLGKYFLTHKASTAWEAITSYIRTAPDIVFLDIDMPIVNGHEILIKILEIDPKAHIIMLSGHSHHDNIKKSIETGAKGFITKPFTKDRIIQYIQQCPNFQSKKQKVINHA